MKVLRLLGQVIGNDICIDYNTELATRDKIAQIAVEFALDKPLCSQFLLDGRIQKVEYESLPTICFDYGTYGHLNSSCLEKIVNGETETSPGTSLDRTVEVEAMMQPDHAEIGVTSIRSRFSPLMNADDNDERFISTNETTMLDSRSQPSDFSKTHHESESTKTHRYYLTTSKVENSHYPSTQLKNSTITKIDEDLLQVRTHSSDPSDRREINIEKSEDDFDDSDDLGDSEE
ncbi:hypothetical protein WN943_022828 [Citrus x changshan-huyou]